MKGIKTAKLILTNINFQNISAGIDSIVGSFIHFHINSFDEFMNGLTYIKLSKHDMIRVKNLAVKFKPLFNCIDVIIADPIKYIHKIAKLTTNEYDNIF